MEFHQLICHPLGIKVLVTVVGGRLMFSQGPAQVYPFSYLPNIVMVFVLVLMVMVILVVLVLVVPRMMVMVILVSLLTDDWPALPQIRHVTPRTLHTPQPTLHIAHSKVHAKTHIAHYTAHSEHRPCGSPHCRQIVHCSVHTARHPPHRRHSVITHSIAIWSIIIPLTLILESDFLHQICSIFTCPCSFLLGF